MRACLALLLLTLSACSMYENAGRKYLESNSYSLAGLQLRANTIGCDVPVADPSWTPDAADARVFRRDVERGFELRVETEPGRYACDYVFPTAAERDELRLKAIEATLERRP